MPLWSYWNSKRYLRRGASLQRPPTSIGFPYGTSISYQKPSQMYQSAHTEVLIMGGVFLLIMLLICRDTKWKTFLPSADSSSFSIRLSDPQTGKSIPKNEISHPIVFTHFIFRLLLTFPVAGKETVFLFCLIYPSVVLEHSVRFTAWLGKQQLAHPPTLSKQNLDVR